MYLFYIEYSLSLQYIFSFLFKKKLKKMQLF